MNILSAASSKQLRDAVLEHNVLNGFLFVAIEFFLVMLAALFIGCTGLIHGNISVTVFGLGVAVNSLTVLLMAMQQRHNNEHDEGLMKFWSAAYRQRIAANHPGLGGRTLAIVIAILVPFLLTAMVNRK